jgi:cytoskeletal protein CcmA (bactofilin family)
VSIFGKSKSPDVPVRVTRTDLTDESTSSQFTVIGRGTVIQGEISSDDQVQVDGNIEGNLTVKNTVIVGKTGRITADITATSILVHGKVIGDVVSTERVTIERSGSVEGNVRTPKLVISEGAHFRGNIDMSQNQAPVATPKPLLATGGERRFGLRQEAEEKEKPAES